MSEALAEELALLAEQLRQQEADNGALAMDLEVARDDIAALQSERATLQKRLRESERRLHQATLNERFESLTARLLEEQCETVLACMRAGQGPGDLEDSIRRLRLRVDLAHLDHDTLETIKNEVHDVGAKAVQDAVRAAVVAVIQRRDILLQAERIAHRRACEQEGGDALTANVAARTPKD